MVFQYKYIYKGKFGDIFRKIFSKRCNKCIGRNCIYFCEKQIKYSYIERENIPALHSLHIDKKQYIAKLRKGPTNGAKKFLEKKLYIDFLSSKSNKIITAAICNPNRRKTFSFQSSFQYVIKFRFSVSYKQQKLSVIREFFIS